MSTAVSRAARPWFKKKRYNIPLGIVVASVALGSLGDSTTDKPVTPASNSQVVVTETATATVTVTAEPEPQNETDGTNGATEAAMAEPEPSVEAPSTPPAKPKAEAKARPVRTYLVSRVVDGDTVELGTGDAVRIVGIDTPERGECGYDAATANMERLVLGRRVRLALSDEDHDRYGRLLRFVDVKTMDAGLRQIKDGLAIARYDSRDGYGEHPRESRYITADQNSPSTINCAPKPKPISTPQPQSQGGGCAPGYDPCLPNVDDLNCADVDGPISVTGSDPYGLDREDDGIACES